MTKINKLAFDLITNEIKRNSNYYISEYELSKSMIKNIIKSECQEFTVKAVKAEILRIAELRKDRKTFADWQNMTFRQKTWLTERKKTKANKIAKYLPNMGYSMGQYNLLKIKNTDLVGSYSNEQEYSKSSKYKASHGFMKFEMTAKEFQKCEVIGGLITIFGKKVAKDLFACTWIQSEGNYGKTMCIKKQGYIYKDYHFTASNNKDAISKVKKAKQAEYERNLRNKQEAEYKLELQNLPLTRVFVELNDSLYAGNCAPGTHNFAKMLGIDLSVIGAVRADYLYDNRMEFEGYVNRAINHAKMRYINNNLI